MPILRVRDSNGNFVAVPGIIGPRGEPGKGLSAYDAAKEAGYTGTEEEFNAALADIENKAPITAPEFKKSLKLGGLGGKTDAEVYGNLLIQPATTPELVVTPAGASRLLQITAAGTNWAYVRCISGTVKWDFGLRYDDTDGAWQVRYDGTADHSLQFLRSGLLTINGTAADGQGLLKLHNRTSNGKSSITFRAKNVTFWDVGKEINSDDFIYTNKDSQVVGRLMQDGTLLLLGDVYAGGESLETAEKLITTAEAEELARDFANTAETNAMEASDPKGSAETAKKEAIAAASADATTKANAAEANAKNASLPKAGGTMTGALIAAAGDATTPQVRNIYFGTVEIEDGSASDQPEGTMYFTYE